MVKDIYITDWLVVTPVHDKLTNVMNMWLCENACSLLVKGAVKILKV